MQKLEISKENAIKTYNEGCNDVKKILINLFGKEPFIPKSTIDKIDSFVSACKEVGEDHHDPKFQIGTDDEIATKKMKIICKALCGEVKLTYKNNNQRKWYPVMVWDESTSGFRFYGAGYVFSAAYSGLGSRLQVDTEEKAKYLGTHPEFVTLWNKILINHEI